MKPVFTIDGRDIESLSDLFRVLTAVLGFSVPVSTFDGLDDVLRGDMGTPEGGFVLRWKHAELSRARLGYAATVAWLEERLENGHPANRARFAAELAAARLGRGPTVYDFVVDIFRHHGPGGEESEDGVELDLRHD